MLESEQSRGAPPRWWRRAAVVGAVAATTLSLAAIAVTTTASAAPASPASPKARQTHYAAPSCAVQKNTRTYAKCFALGKADDHNRVIINRDGPPSTALGPSDIQSAYNLPASGAGVTVAIVDAFGYPNAEADLQQFRNFYGLPSCTSDNGCFTKVDQRGGTDYPPADDGWSIETALDLDAVSSACPKCKLLLVEGDDNSLDNLGQAVDEAVSLGAKYVSNSYGVAGEDSSETDYDHYYTHAGVAVVASTGDAGNVTNWPATNPTVTAAAGTTLNRDSGSPRGWTESAWADGGSGCSPFEPRPDYQQNIATNCPDNKAIGDISADADPQTGLGIYSTAAGGWAQYGGTSLSAPLLTAMYALAGPPVAGTYPVSYPYAKPSGLNDVTTGSNGSCGNVLCEAGPGWDGPTGLGTPNGVSSLSSGPHGTLNGTVTNASTHNPIANATVNVSDGTTATTNAQGKYSVSLATGTYDVTASAFGYSNQKVTGIAITKNHTTTQNFALRAVPSRTVSGTVKDGSGHGWPLYAKITIDGYPNGAVYTNPYTGQYSVSLPQNKTYTMHVTPQVLNGYTTKDVTVKVTNANVTKNIAVPVDATSCTAPGYHIATNGATEDFTGWTGTTPQDGWDNVDNEGNGQVWNFDNPGSRTPPPNSDGDFAIIDSDHYGSGNTQDSSLVSPTIDLSTSASPAVGFDTYYRGFSGQVGDVDVSTDGGSTWTNVWEATSSDVIGHVDVQLPQAAHQANVKVRFHFTSSFGWWWAVDNVFLGTRSCVPNAGGLVAGVVTDANTHAGLVGAKVTSVAKPAEYGVTVATPDDPNVPDGFYEFFSSLTGPRKFTATDGKYTAATATVNVVANGVAQKNWNLGAGHVIVVPHSVQTTVPLGGSKTTQVVVKNTGNTTAHVTLSEQSGTFTPQSRTTSGAPLTRIRGTFSTAAAVTHNKSTGATTKLRTGSPADDPWTDIADYPTPVMDNAAAYGDGKVYSIAGYNGTDNVANGYVYDSASASWSAIADAPAPLESPAATYAGGKVYLVGGWGADGNPTNSLYIYDPASDSWSSGADLPESISAASVTTLEGKVYVVGGCTTGNCAPTSNAVYVYDPASNSWSQAADYPQAAAFAACAGVAGEVVCAGGVNADTNVSSNKTYVYDPGSDSWTAGADMPYDDWAMAYAGANDKLQIAAGVTANSQTVTNQAAEYDPSSDSWTALANANNAEYRGGGTCGLYKIGGSTGGFNPNAFSEVLPGYDQCGSSPDVPWLSETPTTFALPAGTSRIVQITTDSSSLSQPGNYTASIALSTDTPYSVTPIGVTMTVTPPASWGKVTGVVTDAATGQPIAGATVQICTMYDSRTGRCGEVSYTLKTDANGQYQYWLSKGYNPLQLLAAKDGYQPQARLVKITAGQTTTVNFALRSA